MDGFVRIIFAWRIESVWFVIRIHKVDTPDLLCKIIIIGHTNFFRYPFQQSYCLRWLILIFVHGIYTLGSVYLQCNCIRRTHIYASCQTWTISLSEVVCDIRLDDGQFKFVLHSRCHGGRGYKNTGNISRSKFTHVNYFLVKLWETDFPVENFEVCGVGYNAKPT